MQFLESVISQLVDFPEDIDIKRSVDEMGVLLTLSVNSADMGRIVGREGATADHIRGLLRVWGMKNQQRIFLKIIDPPGAKFLKNGAEDEEKV